MSYRKSNDNKKKRLVIKSDLVASRSVTNQSDDNINSDYDDSDNDDDEMKISVGNNNHKQLSIDAVDENEDIIIYSPDSPQSVKDGDDENVNNDFEIEMQEIDNNINVDDDNDEEIP